MKHFARLFVVWTVSPWLYFLPTLQYPATIFGLLSLPFLFYSVRGSIRVPAVPTLFISAFYLFLFASLILFDDPSPYLVSVVPFLCLICLLTILRSNLGLWLPRYLLVGTLLILLPLFLAFSLQGISVPSGLQIAAPSFSFLYLSYFSLRCTCLRDRLVRLLPILAFCSYTLLMSKETNLLPMALHISLSIWFVFETFTPLFLTRLISFALIAFSVSSSYFPGILDAVYSFVVPFDSYSASARLYMSHVFQPALNSYFLGIGSLPVAEYESTVFLPHNGFQLSSLSFGLFSLMATAILPILFIVSKSQNIFLIGSCAIFSIANLFYPSLVFPASYLPNMSSLFLLILVYASEPKLYTNCRESTL